MPFVVMMTSEEIVDLRVLDRYFDVLRKWKIVDDREYQCVHSVLWDYWQKYIYYIEQ